MRQKPEAYFLIFILLVSLALIIRSIAFPYLESKLLPLIIGGIVFVLTAVALIMELRAKEKPKRVREPWEGEELELRQYGWTGAWLGGYALAIYLLGFIIATPALCPLLSEVTRHRVAYNYYYNCGNDGIRIWCIRIDTAHYIIPRTTFFLA